jgi:hypothetical protein
MFARIWQLLIKEVIQVARDRLLVVFVFTFPLLQLVLVAQKPGRRGRCKPATRRDGSGPQPSQPAPGSVVEQHRELNLRYIPATMDELKRLLDSAEQRPRW